jgi:sugar fermentation stimulation protein A
MHFPGTLVDGVFVERRNRFVADVMVNGVPALAYVPNTGRMRELMVPGHEVLLRPVPEDSCRRTVYDLLVVKYQGHWVGIDSRTTPTLAIEAWQAGLLPELSLYTHVKREVKLGVSRLDLLLEGPPGLCYVEVKSVNLVEEGVALFPDAPTERGARHLGELSGAARDGHQAAAVFIVQRDDATALAPFESADRTFAKALRQAVSDGVGVYAIACKTTPEGQTPMRQVPVLLEQPATVGQERSA